jgi:hypothetical protein
VRDVNMNACFFAGEEEQAELSVAYNCGSHLLTVPE